LKGYIYITSSYLNGCADDKTALRDYLLIELDKCNYNIKGIVILLDVLLDKNSITNIQKSCAEIKRCLREDNNYKSSFFSSEIIVRPLSEYIEKSPNLQKLIDNVKEAGLDAGCIKPYISIPDQAIMQWVGGELKINQLTKKDRCLGSKEKNITKRRKEPIIWVKKIYEEEKALAPDGKRFCPLNKV
jgi:hypothetical protein